MADIGHQLLDADLAQHVSYQCVIQESQASSRWQSFTTVSSGGGYSRADSGSQNIRNLSIEVEIPMGETGLTAGSILRRRMDIRVRNYRGRLYIAVQYQTLELDKVAEDIFRRLDGTSTVRKIAVDLAEDYGVSVEQAIDDVTAFLAQLIGYGVAEVVA
ncbi:PqqD family protein [Streptomyces sp. NPDC050619]|uniref:PqqD family protein n=1 Tax=Streptomyces sp. NPDC050619 TaxID=3157214 RepID=UPI003435A837